MQIDNRGMRLALNSLSKSSVFLTTHSWLLFHFCNMGLVSQVNDSQGERKQVPSNSFTFVWEAFFWDEWHLRICVLCVFTSRGTLRSSTPLSCVSGRRSCAYCMCTIMQECLLWRGSFLDRQVLMLPWLVVLNSFVHVLMYLYYYLETDLGLKTSVEAVPDYLPDRSAFLCVCCCVHVAQC